MKSLAQSGDDNGIKMIGYLTITFFSIVVYVFLHSLPRAYIIAQIQSYGSSPFNVHNYQLSNS